MTVYRSRWIAYYLFVTMAVSSFVMIEPSPYDLMIVLVIVICFVFSIFSFSKEMILPLVILCIFLITNFSSIFFIEELGPSAMFTAITIYLALTWIGLVGMNELLVIPRLQFVLHGYLVSACLSAIIGLLAYFNLIPYSDVLLMYGRAKALFKDPNVYGPFLIMPAIFSLSMTEKENISFQKKIFYYLLFLLLAAGIIISFSRAAWGNFVISLCIYLGLFKVSYIKARIRTIIFVLIICLPVIFYFIQTPMVEDLLVSRLSYKEYDNDRFGTQLAAFETGLSNPLGIGSGQSELAFEYSPHSLYARVFTENGLLGLLSFVSLIILSIYRAFLHFWRTSEVEGNLKVAVFACLIGLVFNSIFVDTLHWRHFWLLLALAWIPVKKNE